MNLLDTRPSVRISPSASFSDPQAGRRLIVLVSETDADPASASKRIWDLAIALNCSVHLLGMCHEETQESSLRRVLITLAALLENVSGPVESNIEFGTNWLEIVESHLREGDALVCFAGQSVGLARKPLSQLLQSNLHAPVYVLTDTSAQEAPRAHWISSLISWGGSIGIIAAFFLLQDKVGLVYRDTFHTALLWLSVPAEVMLIWFWNSFFE